MATEIVLRFFEDDDFLDKFWSNVNVIESTGCWEWAGKRMPYGGYGRISIGGMRGYAHRVAWMLSGRTLTPGRWILHHCDNPPCIRPDHMYMGTPKDNAQDREKRGRGRKRERSGAECIRGHVFDADNPGRNKRGVAMCKVCDRERHRKQKPSAT